MIINPSDQKIGTNRMGQEELLTEILDSIKLEVPEIHAVLLVSAEGLPIASTRFDMGHDETILSAMTAALVSVAEQASLELDKGEPNAFIVDCPNGLIVLRRFSEDVIISVVTRAGVRLGLLLFALKKAQTKLGQIL